MPSFINITSMSKAGLVLFAGLILAMPARAEDVLSAYERQLFSQSYEGQPIENRLDRLETSLFGQPKTGDSGSRQRVVIQMMERAKEIVPTEPKTTGQKPPSTAPHHEPAAAQLPDATDYPTVTALEQEVFGRDFIRDNIHRRLSRLEKKVFQKTYENVALVDRVDKLLMRYPNISMVTMPQGGGSSVLDGLPNDSSQMAGSSRDVYLKLDALEKAMLNRSYSGDLLTERLDRLELRMLGQVFGGGSVDSRVDRLIRASQSKQAANAPPSAPTIQQSIPVPQPPAQTYVGNQSSRTTTTYGTGQNIRIGSTMGMNSTYQFSPEMMEMLPPDVRYQLMGVPSKSFRVEDTVTYPGVTPYGAPMGTNTSTYNSQTTVLQPPGSTMTVTEERLLPGIQNDLVMMNGLTQLENRLYKQNYQGTPIAQRLSQMELTLFGQVYYGHPPNVRLNNIQQAIQYHQLGQILNPNAQNGANVPPPGLGIPIFQAPK